MSKKKKNNGHSLQASDWLSGFHVIEFKTPSGIASPVNRTNPGFVGKGRTAGGAKEFVVPNQKIPQNAKKKIIE